jgi:hypothetical protein
MSPYCSHDLEERILFVEHGRQREANGSWRHTVIKGKVKEFQKGVRNDNEQTYKDNTTIHGKCFYIFIRVRRR